MRKMPQHTKLIWLVLADYFSDLRMRRQACLQRSSMLWAADLRKTMCAGVRRRTPMTSVVAQSLLLDEAADMVVVALGRALRLGADGAQVEQIGAIVRAFHHSSPSWGAMAMTEAE